MNAHAVYCREPECKKAGLGIMVEFEPGPTSTHEITCPHCLRPFEVQLEASKINQVFALTVRT